MSAPMPSTSTSIGSAASTRLVIAAEQRLVQSDEMRVGGAGSASSVLADQAAGWSASSISRHQPLVGRQDVHVLPGEVGLGQRREERPGRGAAGHRERRAVLGGVRGAQLVGDQLGAGRASACRDRG